MDGSRPVSPPEYFARIRDEAVRRWDQLQADPGLAGPWQQLFKQVQDPRHVLSELLQNADDAGASRALVKIEGDTLVLEHDGKDFVEEHFRSICNFGFSNKRSLSTIGFRGIGWKSTFSLGDQVELMTPSLSVEFRRERFTRPEWVARPLGKQNLNVMVRVRVREESLRDVLAASFEPTRLSQVRNQARKCASRGSRASRECPQSCVQTSVH
ncbi:sacsin N-terminal ATP-binding-like domain-containing protein [Tepidiforma sp.]|uniref:sacsin N-terminal ATP-binding-like domain-containing protein n=1 Tax=Tepidiforma sp. TaxID=2682230 RepID=UPI002ADDF70C|nr:hypothetical protein [Tepidiforma sp.]